MVRMSHHCFALAGGAIELQCRPKSLNLNHVLWECTRSMERKMSTKPSGNRKQNQLAACRSWSGPSPATRALEPTPWSPQQGEGRVSLDASFPQSSQSTSVPALGSSPTTQDCSCCEAHAQCQNACTSLREYQMKLAHRHRLQMSWVLQSKATAGILSWLGQETVSH